MVGQKIQHRRHILGILEPEQLVKSIGGATSLTGLIYSEDPVKVKVQRDSHSTNESHAYNYYVK